MDESRPLNSPSIGAGSDISGEDRTANVSYGGTTDSELPPVSKHNRYLDSYQPENPFMNGTAFHRGPHDLSKNVSMELPFLGGSVPPSETSQQTEDQPFTVEREEKNESARKYKKKKSVFLSILKCIISFLMSVCLLGCVVASKLSLVTLGQKVTSNFTLCKNSPMTSNSSNASFVGKSSGSNGQSQYQNETIFNMLVLILIIPNAYSFLRALFSSGFKRSHPWPTKRAIIWVRVFI